VLLSLSLPVRRWGRRVGVLGPGLTCEPADAHSVVLRNDLSTGSQDSPAPTGVAGLICSTWTRGQDSQVVGQQARATPQL
jgi:hypothetical protein